MAVILLVVETRVQVKKKKLMCHKPLNNFDNEEAGKIHFHDQYPWNWTTIVYQDLFKGAF
jgi:CRISPR/Cas system CMR subunit Cmr6 (Cas7 group RAMP superfamily)